MSKEEKQNKKEKQEKLADQNEEIQPSSDEDTQQTNNALGAEGDNKEPGLPTAKNLLTKTLNDYGERFWTYLGLIVAPFLLIALLSIGLITLFSALASFFGLDGATGVALVILLLLPLLFIIILLLAFWGQAALITALIEERAPFLDYYKKSARKLLQYWWVSVLVGFAVLGGLLLFIVPGIVLAIWFLFASMLVITENEKGFPALLKSREYMRGNWTSVLWLMVFFGIIVILVSFVFNLLITLILGGENIVSELLSSAWSIVLAPLTTIYIFNLYKSIKETRGPVEVKSSVKLKAGVIAAAVIGFLLIPVAFILLALASLQDFGGASTEETTPLFELEELNDI